MEEQNGRTDPSSGAGGAGSAGGAGGQQEPSASGEIDNEPVGSEESLLLTTGKPDTGKRIVAAVIDSIVGGILYAIPAIGGLVSAAYWLARDGLDIDFMDRRSIGKKVMKLRPMRLDGQPMDIATSAMRNWMFALYGVASFLAHIPFLGWLLFFPILILACLVALYELFRVLNDPQGRRLGDTMAGTKVIEVAD